jgi:hypothetical protein
LGRPPAEIVGSNPTGGMDVYRESCVSRQRSLRRADHPSRGLLPTVVRRWGCPRNLVNEKALAHWGGGGSVAPKQKKNPNNFFKTTKMVHIKYPLFLFDFNET